MSKQENFKRIAEVGIIPVVRAASSKQALQATEALSAGGIPIVEITMTVPDAIDVIAKLTRAGNAILVGAGTILDAATAERCIDAGAQFVVSPGFDPDTVKAANRRGVLIMAGALTPSEVIAAWNAGSDLVKIFPCDSVGGAKYIKSLKGPLPQIPMVPTGGVNLNTVGDLIRAGSEAVGVGGELVSKNALNSGDLAPITEAATKFVAAVRGARQDANPTAS